MRTSHFKLVPLAGLLLMAVTVARAEDKIKYAAQPTGSKVTIEGTSTIHDWKVEGAIIGGTMEADASFEEDFKPPKNSPKVEVNIPIRSLKSGKKTMDNVMMDAMKQKDHPRIEYRLIELKAKPTPAQFEAIGTLTISGVTRTNTMPVTFEKPERGKIKIMGVTDLKMTDFGITPPAPSIAGGAIKTGDDVKIRIDWVVAREQAAK